MRLNQRVNKKKKQNNAKEAKKLCSRRVDENTFLDLDSLLQATTVTLQTNKNDKWRFRKNKLIILDVFLHQTSIFVWIFKKLGKV